MDRQFDVHVYTLCMSAILLNCGDVALAHSFITSFTDGDQLTTTGPGLVSGGGNVFVLVDCLLDRRL